MANPMSQKKLAVQDFRQIGEVVQSPINLEALTKGRFIALDGRDCNRADYPELSPYFPAGVFTSTARTLNAAPATPTVTADTTNYLVAGAVGTSALQASADAITWSTSATWAASTAFPSVIVAGSRYIAAPSAGESQPYVINTGGTAANLPVKANWTVTTSGLTTALTQGLAYSPQLGLTVLVKGGALATASGIVTLTDGATAWGACSGGSTQSRAAVVWTGQKFLCMSAPVNGQNTAYQTSTDGATWSDNYLPYVSGNTTAMSLASDGVGTVVSIFFDPIKSIRIFLVSKDHGLTWRRIQTPSELPPLTVDTTVKFVNDKFIASNTGATGDDPWTYVSRDALSWFYEPIPSRGILPPVYQGFSFAYKNGVYVGIPWNSTAALSSVEDLSKFRLPSVIVPSGTTAATYGLSITAYIKARSN